jgi:hypothetical protein
MTVNVLEGLAFYTKTCSVLGFPFAFAFYVLFLGVLISCTTCVHARLAFVICILEGFGI